MHVFQVGEGQFPPLRSLDAFPGNLPRQVTSFVGREREVAAVTEALGQAPVVALTEVGGVGKTRLALHSEAEVLPCFREAWLVELGSVRDAAQVVNAATGVFWISVAPGAAPEDGLVEFLRNEQLVRVIDNCEHLIGAAASPTVSCPTIIPPGQRRAQPATRSSAIARRNPNADSARRPPTVTPRERKTSVGSRSQTTVRL